MSDVSRIQSVKAPSRITRQRKSTASASKSTMKTERVPQSSSSREQLLRAVRSLGIEQDGFSKKSSSNINERLQRRLQTRERRRQDNLEKILGLALDYAPAKTNNDELDIDWLNSFLQQAEDISSPAMQKLWAKIMASESARPGSFSLKTIATLKRLTVREADIFRRGQALTCRDSRHQSNKIITGYYRRPSLFTWLTLNKPVTLNLARAGLSYPDTLALADLGILYPAAIESGELEMTAPLQLNIGGDNLTLTPRTKGLVLTYHKYTAQGDELLRLLPLKSQQTFIDMLQEHFSRDFVVAIN